MAAGFTAGVATTSSDVAVVVAVVVVVVGRRRRGVGGVDRNSIVRGKASRRLVDRISSTRFVLCGFTEFGR